MPAPGLPCAVSSTCVVNRPILHPRCWKARRAVRPIAALASYAGRLVFVYYGLVVPQVQGFTARTHDALGNQPYLLRRVHERTGQHIRALALGGGTGERGATVRRH